MCAVSMVSDDWSKRWPTQFPNIPITPNTSFPTIDEILQKVTRQEYDALKKDVEDIKALLKAAKIYDEATGQPDCEAEDKGALLIALAKALNIDLEDLFKKV